MLLPASVDDYVSNDSPVRAIDAFVDLLDLGKLGIAVRPPTIVGRASYHPSVLLKLFLWGYVSRTRSSRRLEEACSSNLQAIWLTGNLQPDHSTISDFRKHHSATLKGVFREFNLLCLDMNLFGRELVAIDGTFMKAVNGRARSFTKEKLINLMESIDQNVSRYLEELESTDQQDQQGIPSGRESKLKEKLEKLKQRRGELEALLWECQSTPTGQVNLTDPDSRQLRKRGKSTVGYNVQSAVDDKHHLIASCEVTQEANDTRLLDQMAQQAKEDLRLQKDAALGVLADTGYGCPVELGACEAHKTQAYVPMPKQSEAGDGSVSNESFTYQEESDSYLCPEGKSLPRKSDDIRSNGNGYRVYYEVSQCRGCPRLAHCTKGEYRKFKVSIHKAAIAAAEQRLRDNLEIHRKRKTLVEHPFGTIKEWNGGRDLLCRGLDLAGAEMRMSFWAYNFKRVLNVVGIAELLAAISARKIKMAA